MQGRGLDKLRASEPASHVSHASHHVSHARQMLVPSLARSQSGNNKTGKGVFKLSVTQPPLLIMFTMSLII